MSENYNILNQKDMEVREIYHTLKSIVEPIHAHNDQMVAIAKWIEAEFEYKPSKHSHTNKYSCTECGSSNVIIKSFCGDCGSSGWL